MVKSFVHGQQLISDSSDFFLLKNPATNEDIEEVQLPSMEDIERAIKSAHEGYLIWRSMSPVERSRILMKSASLLRERNEEIAMIEVEDTGKPLAEAIAVDVLSGADAIEYFAGLVPYLHGHQYDLGKSFAYTRKEPLGVCAGIGAWNYPIQIACWKSAPALAAGNAMIFKPAELTPRSAVLLAETYMEAGMP
ncbi:MAG: aldehyde dehydrogenase family protein, partial [Saprospiraceae bacterium]|nr:aldehyde dehydrogenase family protein [Saprospiraceae bacterium]